MPEFGRGCTGVSETLERRVESEGDLGIVRRQVRDLAQSVNLGLVQKTKLVTATSELVRNMLEHGGGSGLATMRLVRSELRGSRTGIEVVFEDRGPGINDLERALGDGYTTGRGLGLGLGGSRRLVDDFEIESVPGEGTKIRICTWS